MKNKVKKEPNNILWKTLDKYFKSSILNTYFKSLDFLKYFVKSISKKLISKRKFLAHLNPGNFLKGKAMFSKSFLRDPFESIPFCVTALLMTILVVSLTACGGGGGDSPAVTPPVSGGTSTVVVTPTTYTATTLCASGPALTSTMSQAAANALVPSACPALPASAYAATSVVVGSGTLTISVSGLPSGFTSGVLTATKFTPDISVVWDLIPTTTGNASATLRSGSSALGFATGYAGSVEMNFVGAPSARKTLTFTTSADPSVTLRDQAKAMIIPQGVQKVVPTIAQAVADEVNLVTDPRFLQAVIDGKVLAIDVGDLMSNSSTTSYRTRPLVVFIYYWKGFARIKHAFRDDLTGSVSNSLNDSLFGFVFDRTIGVSTGLLIRAQNPGAPNDCSLMGWDTIGRGFGGNPSTACPVWN